jgi:cell volume regulation protein A
MHLDVPSETSPPVTLEISSLHHVDGDIVDYSVPADSKAAGRTVRELALPTGVVIALASRGREIVPPQGSTRLNAGDHVIVIMKTEVRPLVDRIFASEAASRGDLPTAVEFPLRGTTTVAQLQEMYGVQLGGDASETLSEAIRQRLGDKVAEGAIVPCGGIALRVRRLSPTGAVEQVGMILDSKQAE